MKTTADRVKTTDDIVKTTVDIEKTTANRVNSIFGTRVNIRNIGVSFPL